MKNWISMALLCSLTASAAAQAAPQKTPPRPSSSLQQGEVRSVNWLKRRIIFATSETKLVPVQKVRVVEKNGKKVTVPFTVYEARSVTTEHVIPLYKIELIDRTGRKLTEKEARSRLRDGLKLLISTGAKKIEKATLEKLSKNGLILRVKRDRDRTKQ